MHFCNTRDVLAACGADGQDGLNSPMGQTCQPAPEVLNKVSRTQIGTLDLSGTEKDAIIAVPGTLSDGYAAGP